MFYICDLQKLSSFLKVLLFLNLIKEISHITQNISLSIDTEINRETNAGFFYTRLLYVYFM